MSLPLPSTQPGADGLFVSPWYAVSRASGTALAGAIACVVFLAWNVIGSDTALQHLTGMSDAFATPAARLATIAVATPSGAFSPPMTLVVAGGRVTFVNGLDVPVDVRSAGPSPEALAISLAPHSRTTVTLARPGLYHYYDALTARPRRLVVGNMPLAALSANRPLRQGWIAVLGALPPLREQLTVPTDHDLFSPKAVVAVVGSTIEVANHDADAHNFVVDPASPSGGAFIVTGTDGEPPNGWQRSLVVQQPGLYHVYCSLHTRVVGVVDGWQVVVPRMKASGYADRDPMEAWIVVLPANTTR